jgi:hypothetical protein
MILWRFESGFLDQPPKAAVPGPRPQLTASHMLSLQSVSARGAVLFGRLTDVEGPRDQQEVRRPPVRRGAA